MVGKERLPQELTLVLSKYYTFSNVRGTNPFITLCGPQYNFSLMRGTNSPGWSSQHVSLLSCTMTMGHIKLASLEATT